MSSGSLLQPLLQPQVSYQPGQQPGSTGSVDEWVLLPPGEPAYEDVEAIWESKWFGPEELSFMPHALEQGHQRDDFAREAKGLQSAYCKTRRPHSFYNFARHISTPTGSQTPSALYCFSPEQGSLLQQPHLGTQEQLPSVSSPPLPKCLSTMQGISNLRDSGLPFVDHRASTSLPTPLARTPSSDVATPSGIQGARAISDGDGTGGSSTDMRAVEEDASSSFAGPAAKQQNFHAVGTWAHRQTRLHGGPGLHSSSPVHNNLHAVNGGPHVLAPIIEGNPPGTIAMAATPPGRNVADVSKLSLQQLQQQQQGQGGDSSQLQGDSGRESMDSDAEAGAAWKWRFARRWHIEQTRPADPDGASPDKTEEAIAFLNAGGGAGWNMQVDRTTSSASRANSTLQSMGTLPGMGSLLAHEMLMEENTPTTPPVQKPGQLSGPASNAINTQANNRTSWSSEPWQATREVNSLNRRAANLLEQQQRLEAAAEERWRVAVPAEDRWLGTYLPAVEIEEWGTFKFLVCRLRGRGGKQRICVRGRNYYTQSQIIDDISRKVQALATQHGLAMEHLEIMGGGVMEWRRERDRHLCIYSGYLAQAPPPGVSQAAAVAELLNLAAVLTKQSLPAHYKVSIGA